MTLEAYRARKKREARARRARRKRGQHRVMVNVYDADLISLAEKGYLERVNDPAAWPIAVEAFLFDAPVSEVSDPATAAAHSNADTDGPIDRSSACRSARSARRWSTACLTAKCQ